MTLLRSAHRTSGSFRISGDFPLLNQLRLLSYNSAISDLSLDPGEHSVSTTPTPPANQTFQHHAKSMADQISNCTDLKQLNQIYAHVIRTRFLDLYPHSFHYNNIIRSYTYLDSPLKAQYVFVEMSRAVVSPDRYTLPIVLKAVSKNFDILLLRQFHGVAIKFGLEKITYCESGFISLYSKAGEFDIAFKVFEENGERKLGSWNAIIAGLSQGGRAKETITMFMKMKRCGFQSDHITMVSVNSACGSLGNLSLAHQLHKCVFQARSGKTSDIPMMNSLIDMYGKCGRMDLANLVFLKMEERNVSSWTSMIVGYAMHGRVREALDFFHYMTEAGVTPNHVTFVGVLSACVHGGRVREGKNYFKMMRHEYGISPTLAHYGCMIDLLGREGLLDEARMILEGMPMKPNAIIWGSLMGACEKYGNVEMGEWVAKHLLELERGNDGVYIALSNIYASNNLWEEVERIRKIMSKRELAKTPAYSSPTETG